MAALLIVDWQLAGGIRAWRAHRTHDERLSLAAANPVAITVERRQGWGETRFEIRDTPPVPFAVTPVERLLAGRCGASGKTQIEYSVTPPRRGDFAFGDLYLRWISPLGLWRKQGRIAAAAPVKVYPNLVDVRKYDLLLRQNRLQELGLRTVRRLGTGSEFERLRDYSPDDEYRRIDWKATARRGKPIAMDYETERSQSIVAMLDTGRMMRSPVGDVMKLDYCVNAILLLAYVAAQKGDRVGLLTFADEVQKWVAPRSGRAQFLSLLEYLYAVESQPVEPDYVGAVSHLNARQRRRSLVLLFSDLAGSVATDALMQQMVLLRRHHLPLLVTLRDPGVQALAQASITGEDLLYQRMVAEKLLADRQVALEQLRRHGVLTLDVSASELSVSVINEYLRLKERALI
jgi:uncharacterized protein (DUF58 family)